MKPKVFTAFFVVLFYHTKKGNALFTLFFVLKQNREHHLLLNMNIRDLNNDISFKFLDFEHLKLDETRTNFSQLNFEKWKFSDKSNEVERRADDDLILETYVEFDGLKLDKKAPNASSGYDLEDNDPLNDIVFVDTTRTNLNKLVMSIISDYCIVIEGDLSTGKTMLVEYLARQTNNTLIKYQMDDFMDSKVE